MFYRQLYMCNWLQGTHIAIMHFQVIQQILKGTYYMKFCTTCEDQNIKIKVQYKLISNHFFYIAWFQKTQNCLKGLYNVYDNDTLCL